MINICLELVSVFILAFNLNMLRQLNLIIDIFFVGITLAVFAPTSRHASTKKIANAVAPANGGPVNAQTCYLPVHA